MGERGVEARRAHVQQVNVFENGRDAMNRRQRIADACPARLNVMRISAIGAMVVSLTSGASPLAIAQQASGGDGGVPFAPGMIAHMQAMRRFTDPDQSVERAPPIIPRFEIGPDRSSWGPGGPWAGYAPYTPRPKPAGWIDPEPSRWPWTGERDPYDYPYPSRSDDAASAGPGDETDGAKSAYPNSPPP